MFYGVFNLLSFLSALFQNLFQTAKKIADILRPYGIRVFLSINFATPMALGQTETADPKDGSVRKWWKNKAWT